MQYKDSVLITGATGHLGLTLTDLLVKSGYRVKAGVRRLDKDPRVKMLEKMGAEVVKADLLNPESLENAMSDVQGLFQLAAVYSLAPKNAQERIVKPNMVGTQNIMRTAAKCGVKRVIFTSSTTAVGSHAEHETGLNEESWNLSTTEPYAYAKVQSELFAKRFASEHKIEFISILPSAILGPNFLNHTPSTQPLELAYRGKFPVAAPFSFSFVDVRDVALGHLLAYESGKNFRRYILSAYYCSLSDLFKELKVHRPEAEVPKITLGNYALPMLPALDTIAHHFLGTPRFATRAFVKEYGKKRTLFSSELAKKELGWTHRVFSGCVRDTIEWIVLNFVDEKASLSLT
ncbi:NAD-dependent epimerase/dehydratase family protein [Aliikangiella sp. IMCC44359]|uniref:NAD-dependent epimerase/dehydratase family protein n=1 Tax=Aliikangiella sp. IMCC44359 TaxID=3459125 RepID=UPI00403B0219